MSSFRSAASGPGLSRSSTSSHRRAGGSAKMLRSALRRTAPSLGNSLSGTSSNARRGLASGATSPVNGSAAKTGGIGANKEQRQRALDDVLKDIDGRFGKGTIWKLGESHSALVETFTSGVMPLDSAMGGGYPRGRIIEIYGPESSGKTTLALHAIAEMQKAGGTAALVDAEHAFEPVYAKNLGVNLDELLISQPFSGEDALNIVDSLVRSMAVDVIAVDSVAALIPRAELEGEIGQVQVGAQARLMSSALRKLAGNASKCNCTVIFLNQLRQKIGVVYGNPEVTSGGNALKFYASVRIDVRRKETLKAGGEETGIRCKASIKKNKVAPPFRVAEFDINFGSGISQLGGLLDSAVAANVVSRKGAWYSYNETKLGMGKEKVMQYLTENFNTKSAIETATRAAIRDGLADAGFESRDLSDSVNDDDVDDLLDTK